MTTTPPTAFALDPSQERAVDLVCTSRFGLLTGGPGTGKTTTLRTALDRLDAAPVRTSYQLAAPTGKAARRMAEATGRVATTVHRLLDFGPDQVTGELGFRRNELVPLECELVVVDEASMLDVDLARALFAAVDPETTRLILVGDANQLPSVGPGRVFGDLIESGAAPCARLTQLHRAAQESWVCTQAPTILGGEVPDLSERRDFAWRAQIDRDAALAKLLEVVTRELPARGVAFDAIQVLIPMRIGPAGAALANTKLQALLNPERSGDPAAWKAGEGVALRLRDRVIQTRNDYKLDGNRGVMNGETGLIEEVHPTEHPCPACKGAGRIEHPRVEPKVDAAVAEGSRDAALDFDFQPIEGPYFDGPSPFDDEPLPPLSSTCMACSGRGRRGPCLVVRFPLDGEGQERRVVYDRDASFSLDLAYALTIHKSQGSQWPWVVVMCHSTHSRMLTRQLLYTAITRASEGVVLVGDKTGLGRAVREERDSKRNTGLAARLRAAKPEDEATAATTEAA